MYTLPVVYRQTVNCNDMKLQTIANMSQFDKILVRQHSWEVAPMSSIQLVQNGVAPADVLLVALAALQVLRRQGVETLQGAVASFQPNIGGSNISSQLLLRVRYGNA